MSLRARPVGARLNAQDFKALRGERIKLRAILLNFGRAPIA